MYQNRFSDGTYFDTLSPVAHHFDLRTVGAILVEVCSYHTKFSGAWSSKVGAVAVGRYRL